MILVEDIKICVSTGCYNKYHRLVAITTSIISHSSEAGEAQGQGTGRAGVVRACFVACREGLHCTLI